MIPKFLSVSRPNLLVRSFLTLIGSSDFLKVIESYTKQVFLSQSTFLYQNKIEILLFWKTGLEGNGALRYYGSLPEETISSNTLYIPSTNNI